MSPNISAGVRSRRSVAAGVALGLVAPVVLTSTAAQAAPSEPVPAASVASAAAATSLQASISPAVAGERITLTVKRPTTKSFKRVKASAKRKATLVVQRRDGSKWRDVGKATLKSKKTFRFATTVPKSAKSTVSYRARVKVGKKTYKAGALGLKVAQQRLTVSRNTDDADAAVTYTASLTPARPGRVVTVEQYLDGKWTRVATATARTASTALKVEAARYPAWYRVRAAATPTGVPAVVGTPVRTTLKRTVSEIAHRAGANLAPEQTLAALEASIAAGATSMEIDVQLTQDGVPVIVHDKTFNRTTNVATVFPGRANDAVGTFTWAEVQQLDAGSWKGAQWAGEKIPSLDQWLTAMGGRSHLVLEVKFATSLVPTQQEIAELVGQRAALRAALDDELATGLLGDLAAAGKLTVSSFDHTFLKPFAEAHPDVPVGALVYGAPGASSAADLATWAEEVHSMLAATSQANTDAVRAAGMTTSVWTLEDVADYRNGLVSGAERLITDQPGLLADVLSPPRP